MRKINSSQSGMPRLARHAPPASPATRPLKAACTAANKPGRGIFWFYVEEGDWPQRPVNYAGTGYPAV
jgi:hypothetical protein